MTIRNQLWSDGTLQTWKFNATSTGLPPRGNVTYTVKKIKISSGEREKLRRCEQRRAAADEKIRLGSKSREWRNW